MTPIEIIQVDAFTDRPFAGNPAAVCLLSDADVEAGRHTADPGWMQQVALEMNLSETAFVHRGSGGAFVLRWFTPVMEVDLCGHATLATAHVLWSEGHAALDEVLAFDTRSGRLSAECRGDWIELDFSAEPPEATVPPKGLLSALAVDSRYVGRNRFDHLVEVENEVTVRALAPDFRALEALESPGSHCHGPRGHGRVRLRLTVFRRRAPASTRIP